MSIDLNKVAVTESNCICIGPEIKPKGNYQLILRSESINFDYRMSKREYTLIKSVVECIEENRKPIREQEKQPELPSDQEQRIKDLEYVVEYCEYSLSVCGQSLANSPVKAKHIDPALKAIEKVKDKLTSDKTK